MVREGIKEVGVVSKATTFGTLYLHQEGTLSAPIPGSLKSEYDEVQQASVTHESIELLNYDGKNCNNDVEYNYDKCKQDYIYKVLYISKVCRSKGTFLDDIQQSFQQFLTPLPTM